MPHDLDLAIVGGGVTGLCAAHYARERLSADATVFEASAVPGGNVKTDRMDGFALDWGPNGFLDREPLTLEWVEARGLGGELLRANEAAARRFILKRGALCEVVMPPKFFLSPLLSVRGKARLLCEPLIPGKKDDAPETIWDFAARRIGPEAADTMVSPMVTGIFGGDARQLSLAHCFPRMHAMERDHGGLFRAMLAKRKDKKAKAAGGPAGPGGVLRSFATGIGRLAEAAQSGLGPAYRGGTAVTHVAKSGGGYRLDLESGEAVVARQVLMAAPAHAAARMIEGIDSSAAAALDAIPYASITVACTAYRREQVGHSMDGFGFLVPRTEGRRVLGCIWSSSLFPSQAPEGWVLLRTMVGGATDPDAIRLTDNELLDLVAREVEPLLRISGTPELVRIFRHAQGIPQYTLDHGTRLAAIDAAEAAHPGLAFAGNAYRGVGINDCIVSANRALERLLGPAG